MNSSIIPLDQLRKTGQFLLPEKKPRLQPGNYDIYPSFRLKNNQIFQGYESLARIFLKHRNIIIEGFAGVFFDRFRDGINHCLKNSGKKISWVMTEDYLKSPEIIAELISPFSGGDDPVFGKRTSLSLSDFYDVSGLRNVKTENDAGINIIIGPGASFAAWTGLVVYLDIPKNEIQFRTRAASITNLGSKEPDDPKAMYKRCYFVDWPVLNNHKEKILPGIKIIVDAQRPDCPVWMYGDLLRESLTILSRNIFRVRPWFEPGVWGGTWIRNSICGLNSEVPNYAWSFELITPENGLLFESSELLLEVSFDFLMYQEAVAVLGDCHDRFGNLFPIRFDFLDTFDGGNLSVQCHPRTGYMKRHFGEDFTQEETYYILDAKDNAFVYLGFQDNINPAEFMDELEKSYADSSPADIEKYIQRLPASRHDLFLIPPGTVHGSGKNNLVLEISSTPYIFTFKMYDWLRPDLDGKPRPLNIQRGMDNLYFDRQGAYVREKLISRPVLIEEDEGWQLWHLPTHENHLYDVHRYHLKGTVNVNTMNKCHVLSLVEGESIIIETQGGMTMRFNYAETFIIPAAAGCYRITNESGKEAIVVKAFVK